MIRSAKTDEGLTEENFKVGTLSMLLSWWWLTGYPNRWKKRKKKNRKIWILFWFKAVWLCLCSGLNNKHNINVSVVFTVNHVSLDLDALQSSVCRTTRRSVYLRYNKLCRFYWYERQSSVSSLQRFIKRFLITTTCHLSSSSSRLLPKIYSSDQYQQFTVDNPWGEFLFPNLLSCNLFGAVLAPESGSHDASGAQPWKLWSGKFLWAFQR